jgi:hypothetical protein
MPDMDPSLDRRQFLAVSTAATVATAVTLASPALAPAFVGATDKAGTRPVRVGAGEHLYECHHGWGETPDGFRWGDTHGVAVDEAGFVYITHRSHTPVPQDAVLVFDPHGKFVRGFGKEYHKGGHGIEIRKEGNEEFLYLCNVYHREVIKSTLGGEQVWKLCYPLESGKYQRVGQFSPTNIAFAPDGGFYVADGYGSHYVHQFDPSARWVRSWGGAGSERGQFQTPHGVWLDDRPGRTPSLVVADRANHRLQYFTLEGEWLGMVTDPNPEHTFPAHFETRGEWLLVPDLFARLSLYNGKNEPVLHLGYDPEWTEAVKADNFALRQTPEKCPAGKFLHPHDACFDRDGNIFVVEWVPTGRVSFLKKVS